MPSWRCRTSFSTTPAFSPISGSSPTASRATRGHVQLIDGTRFFIKMTKSLNNKRNEFSPTQIDDITKLYSDFKHDATCKVAVDGKEVGRICSKIFNNWEFGYIKLTVERPLRLNFQASPERMARLYNESAFATLCGEQEAQEQKGNRRRNRIWPAIAAVDCGCVAFPRPRSQLQQSR